MKAWQRGILYTAMALAIVLIIGILGGIVKGLSFLPRLLPSLSGAEESTVSAGESAQIYTPAGTVAGLKIELKAAALEIRTGDAFRAESNLSHLAVTEENGVWAFRETRSFISSDAEAHSLILYIPAQAALEEVTLDTGAGKVRIDTLTADKLELELGAGSFRASTLNATRQADIDGGAGELRIEGGTLANLELDMGVGHTALTARLNGNCSLDMGVGAAAITLLGSREEYRLSIDKGLGGVLIAGESVGDGAAVGNGNTRVKLSGGVGRITVDYREDAPI